MGNPYLSMMLSKNTRVVELVYLLWSLLMAGYWLVLFESLSVPAIVPFGIASVALLVYVVGVFRSHVGLKRASLLLSFGATILFSILAWRLQPDCNCYAFSFVDLVPNAVSLLMMAIAWIYAKR